MVQGRVWREKQRRLSFAVCLDLERGCPTNSVFLERDRHDLALRRDIAGDGDAPKAWQNQHVPCDRELTTLVHQAGERLAFQRCFDGVALWGRESFLAHTTSFHVVCPFSSCQWRACLAPGWCAFFGWLNICGGGGANLFVGWPGR